MLGVGPTYHMIENMKNDHFEDWSSLGVLSDEETAKVLAKILNGYKSSIDFPSCIFYKDLLRMNPTAKVLLTVRDNPEVNYKLIIKQIISSI
jgi:c-di-GMP-related signal transduction protein